MVIQQRRLKQKTIETVGTIIDFKEDSQRGSKVYCPVVSFKDQSGNKVQHTIIDGDNPPAGKKGETLPIYFNPENPREVASRPHQINYAYVFVLGTVGTMILGYGIIILAAYLNT
ncbi:DUF3592 domain-containing protein [Scopulibacillus darangshiensis]